MWMKSQKSVSKKTKSQFKQVEPVAIVPILKDSVWRDKIMRYGTVKVEGVEGNQVTFIYYNLFGEKQYSSSMDVNKFRNTYQM